MKCLADLLKYLAVAVGYIDGWSFMCPHSQTWPAPAHWHQLAFIAAVAIDRRPAQPGANSESQSSSNPGFQYRVPSVPEFQLSPYWATGVGFTDTFSWKSTFICWSLDDKYNRINESHKLFDMTGYYKHHMITHRNHHTCHMSHDQLFVD